MRGTSATAPNMATSKKLDGGARGFSHVTPMLHVSRAAAAARR